MASLLYTSVPTKRLAASISAASSSIQLNNILGWDGAALTSSDFGSKLYCVLRNDSNTLMEIMELDPSTIASASITILRRGLKFTGDLTTEVTANKLVWVKNETLVELGTDVPQLLNHTVRTIEDQTVAGVKTFSDFPQKSGSTTPSAAAEFATKAYVDSVVAGSAVYDQNLISGTAGETLAAGNLVYFKASDQRWWLTDSDAFATAAGHLRLGFAQGTATAGNSTNILLAGLEKNLSGLTAGSKYFVGATAGSISTTPGAITRFIGFATSTTRLVFCPERLPENLIFDTAGETLAVGDIAYFKTSDQKWWKTDADAAATAIGVRIGVCEVAASADAIAVIRTGGIDATHTSLTAGASYYLSGTAGALTTTAGTFQRFYGVALSTTEIVMALESNTTVTQGGQQIYAADSVGTDSYAITLTPAITAYSIGMVIRFLAGTANTGAATLAVNGLSAISITKNYNTALATGDILQNQIVEVIYDGTQFQMLSPVAGGSNALDGSETGITLSRSTNGTTDSTGFTLVLTKSQKVLLCWVGDMSQGSDAQAFTIIQKFKYDSTYITGCTLTHASGDSTRQFPAGGSAVTGTLTAGSHTFNLSLTYSTASATASGVLNGNFYAVAIN